MSMSVTRSRYGESFSSRVISEVALPLAEMFGSTSEQKEIRQDIASVQQEGRHANIQTYGGCTSWPLRSFLSTPSATVSLRFFWSSFLPSALTVCATFVPKPAGWQVQGPGQP